MRFFRQIAGVVDAMIAAHGKDFATGTLLLSARFLVEGRPLTNLNRQGRKPGTEDRTPSLYPLRTQVHFPESKSLFERAHLNRSNVP